MTELCFVSDLTDAFGQAQQWIFESWVQPVVFGMGLGNLLEDAYAATGWLMVGCIQLLVLLGLIGPLQRWRPIEPIVDHRAVRVDIIYTIIHRLGIFRLALFFAITPLLDGLFGWASVHGFNGIQLDALVAPWWGGVTDTAWFSFVLYLVVFDLLAYWIHRGQHGLNAWWALHSLHHSQRQMTMWTDNRNHLLDDVIHDALLAFTARAIGVQPGQFVALIVLTQLMESFSHVNARVRWGAFLERILVGPRFHRVHHGVGTDRCNFAVLFPIWDIVFGTARYDLLDQAQAHPTGVGDQSGPWGATDFGRGFWAQQALGLKRLWRSLIL